MNPNEELAVAMAETALEAQQRADAAEARATNAEQQLADLRDRVTGLHTALSQASDRKIARLDLVDWVGRLIR